MKNLVAASLLLATPVLLGAEGFPDVGLPYERHILPNGLTLIIHEDHKAPIVAVNIWYHVGSKDERPGRTGFAHLFEHLMFIGSENHDDEFFRPLQSAGASKMNGTTWLDRTNYFQNVPTSALDLTLWMESDRMGHLLGAIDQKTLDEQRGVVQNEKRQGENQPYGKVYDLIAANTYPAGHPYSWSTIGSMEDLDAASLEDVKEWFRTYYGAANAVLVIAGDVQPEEVKKEVEHYFGDIPAGPVLKRAQSWVAKMSGEKRATLEDRVPQTRIYKTWNIPGYNTRDFTLLDLAAELLGGGKNSRLYKRLVYTDQTATAVEAGVGPFEIGSQLEVIVTVKPGGDVRAVEKVLDEEIAKFLKTGPTAEELNRIKTTQYATLVRNTERVDGFGGKSALLAQSEVYGGSPDFYRQQLDWMRNATAANVQVAASRWLSDGVFVLTVEPVPDYRVADSGADRSKLPATGTPPALTLPPIERVTLANGLKVALVERHSAPVVQMNLLIDAGYAADSLAKPGTAKLTLAMMDEGTTTRDALEIAARAEELGAQLGAGSTLDTSTLTLNAIRSRLSESLELFSDVLLHPTFPEKDLVRVKSLTLAQIEQEKAQPQGLAFRALPKLIYGEGHAYANPFSGNGSQETVQSLTRADLEAFYTRWVRPDNATLLIVGDTTLAQIKPLLEQRLGAWKAPAEPLPTKNLAAVSMHKKPRVFLINRTGAEQSLVVAGHVAPSRADADYPALLMTNQILGGGFISRLNLNLREDKHWAYGASTRVIDTEGPGAFLAMASVQTDKTAEAMQEAAKELREILAARPPTEEEIRFQCDSFVLSLPGNGETAAEVANLYAEILTFGLPDTFWNDLTGDLDALKSPQVEAAAKKLIHPEALTWVIVGDMAKIEKSVRALNLGEVTVLEAS